MNDESGDGTIPDIAGRRSRHLEVVQIDADADTGTPPDAAVADPGPIILAW